MQTVLVLFSDQAEKGNSVIITDEAIHCVDLRGNRLLATPLSSLTASLPEEIGTDVVQIGAQTLRIKAAGHVHFVLLQVRELLLGRDPQALPTPFMYGY